MIILEFLQNVAPGRYETVGTIRLPDEGEPIITGAVAEELITAPIRDLSRPDRRLWFYDDPAQWLRRSREAFRSGFLVPKIVKDTHPQ